MRGFCFGCDAVIMEFSVGELRFLRPVDSQTCRSWKTWNFFGDFAAAAASCTATNELLRAHVAMKRSGRCASQLPTDRLRRFIFSECRFPRLHASTAARVVARTSRALWPTNGDRTRLDQAALSRARNYAT